MAKRRGKKTHKPAKSRTTGKFLSANDISAAEQEAIARALDLAAMTPQQLARYQRTQQRVKEIKDEKESRLARKKSAGSTQYKWTPKPDKKTLQDLERIHEGITPKPMQRIKHKDYTEYVWAWQGDHSQTVGKELLLHLRANGSQARGYYAVGTGYTKRAEWYGTKHGDLQQVSRDADYLHNKTSAKHVVLAPSGETEHDGRSVWTEVKITVRNGDHEGFNLAVSKRRKK